MKKLLSGILVAMTAVAITGAPVLGDTLHATDDSYTDADKPGSNKGDNRKIKLKDGKRTGFGKFDLSTLGAVTVDEIIKATLRVWIEKVSDDGSLTLKISQRCNQIDSGTGLGGLQRRTGI